MPWTAATCLRRLARPHSGRGSSAPSRLTSLSTAGAASSLRTPVQQPQGAENTPRSRRPLSVAQRQGQSETQRRYRAGIRAAELPHKEEKQIERLHEASGASILENASGLPHMAEGEEKEKLRDLIEADIERAEFTQTAGANPGRATRGVRCEAGSGKWEVGSGKCLVAMAMRDGPLAPRRVNAGDRLHMLHPRADR